MTDELFKQKHTKFLHLLYEAKNEGKITSEDKIMMKLLIMNNKDPLGEVYRLDLGKEKSQILESLLAKCFEDHSELSTVVSTQNDLTFGIYSNEPKEMEINLNIHLEENEISRFFASDVEY